MATYDNGGNQRISIPLTVGSQVKLWEREWYHEHSYTDTVFYRGTVEQFVPKTGLLRMEDGTGRAELLQMIEEAKGWEIHQP